MSEQFRIYVPFFRNDQENVFYIERFLIKIYRILNYEYVMNKENINEYIFLLKFWETQNFITIKTSWNTND
jgi:hypothetical protein